jgi:hypothetical protein
MAKLVFDYARKILPSKWYCENAAKKRYSAKGEIV